MEPIADEEQVNIKEVTLCLRINSAINSRVIGITSMAPRVRSGMGDVKQWHLNVYQFMDSLSFSALEALLIQLNPKEVILSDQLKNNKSSDWKRLCAILDNLSITCTVVSAKLYVSKDLEQDLPRVLGEKSITRFESLLQRREAMEALSCLIKHKNILADDLEMPLGSFELQEGEVSNMMKIDTAAVKALNLLPSGPHVSRYSSLLGVLNHCVTKKLGERLLELWIRQPLVDLKVIESRQKLVGLLCDNLELRETLRDSLLKNTPDLMQICARLDRKKHTKLEHLYIVYQFASNLPALRDALLEAVGEGEIAALVTEKFIKPVEVLIEEFSGYKQLMVKVLDFEALERRPPEFLVNADWSEDLKEIATKRDTVYNKIADLFDDIRGSEWGSEIGIKCEPNKLRGYVFRASKTFDKVVRKNPLVRVCQVKNNGIIFTTSGPRGLEDLASEYKSYQEEYVDAQKDLVAKAIDVACTYIPVIEKAAQVIAELDVIASLAHAAVNAPIPYVCPTLTPLGEGDIVLKECRHPVLELQDDVSFIANDVTMTRDSHRFSVITGPNMGGKSTFIRQVGAVQVMAQIGSFVPASEATMSLVDAVLCRVGAGDLQTRGVSTFMAEMMDASNILATATENSLVIIDELGRGTSTYDGFGLAWAISEFICDKVKCFCLFATHYHELTALSSRSPVVCNLHVSAHTTESSITMLYNVKSGPSDQSYGIHVAELAKFPESVICDAKRKVRELETTAAEGRASKRMAGADAFLKAVGDCDFESMSHEQRLDTLRRLTEEMKHE